MPNKQSKAEKILSDALGAVDENPAPETAAPEAVDDSPALETREDDSNAEEQRGGFTPTDLAEHLGCSVEDIYNSLEIPMPEGAPPTSLGKLKDAERRAQQLESQLRDLEQDKETIDKELQAVRNQGPQAFGGMPPELDQLRMNAARWHEHVYSNQQYWGALKEDDPVRYTTDLTEAQRNAQLAAQQYQHYAGEWQRQQRKQLNDLISSKRRKLAKLDAAWGDDATRKQRYREISEWLRDGGAEVPDNLDEILLDPGWTSRLYDAAKMANKLRDVKDAPRKVGTAKLSKGALLQRGSESNRVGSLNDLIKRANKTGRSSDKRKAGEAILTSAFAKKSGTGD